MSEALKFHNESLMPIIMGSPFRVPAYAYQNYGLTYTGENLSNQAYTAEWASGNKEQVALIAQALDKAGFTDFNSILQKATALKVSEYIKCLPPQRFYVLADIGAGAGGSASAIIEMLPEDIKQKTIFLLVDPSNNSLTTAGQLMEEQEVKYELFTGTDTEILKSWQTESVDILSGVASVHHHAAIPFREYTRVLKMGGWAIFADWHHDIWEHPARVLKFLKRFDWPQKEAGLANWKAAYPQAIDDPDTNLWLTSEELMAREQITKFWLAYKNIADRANLGPNAIWPLEGHRPGIRYLKDMQKAGLFTLQQQKLLPGSTLLQISTGFKLTV